MRQYTKGMAKGPFDKEISMSVKIGLNQPSQEGMKEVCQHS